LEKAYITAVLSRNIATGYLENNDQSLPTEILIHGVNYSGIHCLVRFDLYLSSNMPKEWIPSKFISASVPEGFNGLAPQEYILCAIWQRHMVKLGAYPTIKEVNEYYDPGNPRVLAYFMKNWNRRNGRTLVAPSNKLMRVGSYSSALNNKHFRVDWTTQLVIVESKDQLEELVEIIKKHKLTPIVMDRLK